MDVHQNEIVFLILKGLHGLVAIFSQVNLIPCFAQMSQGYLLIGRVILSQQDVEGFLRSRSCGLFCHQFRGDRHFFLLEDTRAENNRVKEVIPFDGLGEKALNFQIPRTFFGSYSGTGS